MNEQLQKQLNRQLKKLDRSDWSRLGSVTKRGLIQLLPGGPLFDAWISSLKETKELELSLSLVISCLQEIAGDKASETELKRVHATILGYLATFEHHFRQYLDSTNMTHTEILTLLRKLAPPSEVATPTVFLVSGPSASGKDAVLYSLRKTLRARGYNCEFLLKYTTRKPRLSETGGSRATYYQYITDQEFASKLGEGEIILNYSKYGYRYGFSASQLLENTKCKTPTLSIISDFRRLSSTMASLRERGLRVVSIIVYAPAADCRRRMRLRNLEPSEAQRRIDELEDDCRYIEANKEVLRDTYNFWLDNDDGISFNSASTRLYQCVEGSLRCDT